MVDTVSRCGIDKRSIWSAAVWLVGAAAVCISNFPAVEGWEPCLMRYEDDG